MAAVVLGVMGLAVGAFTPIPFAGMALAVLGIAMGLWGLLSSRRKLATTGLCLCFLALFLGGFRCLVQLYTLQHGASPFAPTLEERLTPDELEQLQ